MAAASTSARTIVSASDASVVAVIADATEGGLQPDAGENLYLEVTLNGNATHKIAHVVRSGDAFRISADALRELGFRLPSAEQRVIDVAALPGVAVHYDVAAQRLEITAAPKLIAQNLAVLNERTNLIPQPSASPGLL
ncbi:MAG: hypothetical protein PHG21_15130, partial [Azoarcus sp.]|nr:hypothetical protein [Azoarcus sp.]